MSQNIESHVYATKEGIYSRFIKFIIITAVGGVCGWLGSSMLSSSFSKKRLAEVTSLISSLRDNSNILPNDKERIRNPADNTHNIIQIKPIISNLAPPSQKWLKLKVSLMFKEAPNINLIEDIHQDIMAYIRTVSVQQIEGPRGFQYLRDDIEERINLRSKGAVLKVTFRTFIIG